MKSLLAIIAAISLFVCVSATAAFAGEIAGKSGKTLYLSDDPNAPHELHGNSECAFSGYNDTPNAPGEEGGISQSFGQGVSYGVHAGEDPPGGIPGYACNPSENAHGGQTG